MKITFGLLTLAIYLTTSHQQCLTINDDRQPDKTTRQSLYTGQQAFSLALLQTINRLQPSENLFFSPYSTYHALIIAYFLSGNQTENYLKKVLRLDDKQTKADTYKAYKLDKFMTQIRSNDATYEFTNANKIYVSDQITIRDCIPTIFPTELERLAFKTNPELARNYINQWVDNTTHHMIKDLLPPGSIDTSTNLALVNAAYFKGIWVNKFDINKTKPDIFYVNPSKQIMVDMMHVEGTFNHDVSETLGAHILELPYQGDTISMYILLPPFAKDSLDATLKKFTLEQFTDIVENNRLVSKTVQVSLPKFSLEHTLELVPILESLGVGDLFKSDADFSTLSKNTNLEINRGIHKAKIVVNENGTQAAAATVLVGWRMSDDDFNAPPIQFICNRPFVLLIYNKETHTILFSGVIRNPQNKS